ncbi:MAG: RNA polymerase sigma factor [Cytophagaceae bacterium]
MSREQSEISEEIISELKIIAKAKSDPKHFAPLYERYYEAIFLFIHKRTQNTDISADLTSQVFYKALKNISQFKFMGHPFSSWLYRIAINELNEAFRKQKIQRTVSLEVHGKENLSIDLGFDLLEENENFLILKKCIHALKDEEIQILELRYFEEKSFKEIGYVLDITENNAKVKTYRIIDKLKGFFKNINKII